MRDLRIQWSWPLNLVCVVTLSPFCNHLPILEHSSVKVANLLGSHSLVFYAWQCSLCWQYDSCKHSLTCIRVSLFSLHLHLHFNIYKANVRKPCIHWRKYQTQMKFYARSLELPAHVRDIQGRLYIITQYFFEPLTYYFSLVLASYIWFGWA